MLDEEKASATQVVEEGAQGDAQTRMPLTRSESLSRIPCCENERTHLIQGGRGTSGEHYFSEGVVICGSCGQFRVSAMEDGVWTRVHFSLWNPDTLDAAHKPLERVYADEGGRTKVCSAREALNELRARVEEAIALAETDEDEQGFITAYHFKTGALHRLLAEARSGK